MPAGRAHLMDIDPSTPLIVFFLCWCCCFCCYMVCRAEIPEAIVFACDVFCVRGCLANPLIGLWDAAHRGAVHVV
jgi:hypothetical protein